MTHEQYNRIEAVLAKPAHTKEETVELEALRMIDALYKPSPKDPFWVRDIARLDYYGVSDDEPVNWSALGVAGVKEWADGSFLVTLDECNDCPTLCEYVQRMLTAQGWDCEVVAEW